MTTKMSMIRIKAMRNITITKSKATNSIKITNMISTSAKERLQEKSSMRFYLTMVYSSNFINPLI